jgi:RNA polymerase sigma-70 factor (ECF subfamily)
VQGQREEPDSDGRWVEELFATTGHDVYRYAARRVGPDRAEDVVSETFAVAWRRRSEFSGDPRPWIFGVARRVIAQSRRADRASSTSSLEELAATLTDRAVEDFTEFSIERRDLITALLTMSEMEREVLLLSAWQDLPAAEGAAALGCSLTAYNVRLHRALKHLRQLLPGSADTARPPRPVETS